MGWLAKLGCTWLVLSAIAHVHGVLPFFFHRELADPSFTSWWKSGYAIYGKADTRYLSEDMLIICLQGMTAFLATPLCFLLILGIVKRTWWRHFVQIVLCTAQAYGTIVFFIEAHKLKYAPISADPFDFWVTFVALNALWIVIPLGMLAQSLLYLKRAARAVANQEKASQGKNGAAATKKAKSH